MAGCRPEYMPVLVALVEAMADPRYGVEHSGNTPGAETLIVSTGRSSASSDSILSRACCATASRPTPASAGSGGCICATSPASCRTRPTRATFGNTWRVVLAENEDVMAKMGWTTIAQTWACGGRQRGDDLALHRRHRARFRLRQRAGADDPVPGRRHRADRRVGGDLHGRHVRSAPSGRCWC